VIVHDIALLRAEGHAIDATTRGYRMTSGPIGVRDVFAVRHTPSETQIELMTLVDLGIVVKEVVVDHPVYGELRGGLELHSRRDVDLFLDRLREHGGLLLSVLTGGAHVHTVEAPDAPTLAAGRQALAELGILDEAEDRG
jgi:transcriptional regulator of NAD metabolism